MALGKGREGMEWNGRPVAVSRQPKVTLQWGKEGNGRPFFVWGN